jgi:hypothetical protein
MGIDAHANSQPYVAGLDLNDLCGRNGRDRFSNDDRQKPRFRPPNSLLLFPVLPSKPPAPPGERSRPDAKSLGHGGDFSAPLDLARRSLPELSVVTGHEASFTRVGPAGEASIPARLRWTVVGYFGTEDRGIPKLAAR